MKTTATTSPAAGRSGFTLIELLVVMMIIAILVGLVLSTAGAVNSKARMSRAKSEVEALVSALESYKADNGDYPEGTNNTPSGTNGFLITALMSAESGKRPYFEFSKKMLITNSTSANVLDPWGNRYCYRYPGSNNGSNYFDLWSIGTNSSTNTNDISWIKNW